MGSQRKLTLQRRNATSSTNSELADLGTINPSGAAAIRRTYDIPARGLARGQSRNRSTAGFEGPRPFKTPLTPHTHDNKTGKGRLHSSAKRECLSAPYSDSAFIKQDRETQSTKHIRG